MTAVGHRLYGELILLIMKIRIRPKGIFSFRHNPDRMMLLTAQDKNKNININNVKFNISWYEMDARADGLRDRKGGVEDIDGFENNGPESTRLFQAMMKDGKVVLEFMTQRLADWNILTQLTYKHDLIKFYNDEIKRLKSQQGGRSSRKTRKTKKTHKSRKTRKAKKTHKSKKPRKAKKTHRRRKSHRVNKTHKRK